MNVGGIHESEHIHIRVHMMGLLLVQVLVQDWLLFCVDDGIQIIRVRKLHMGC